MQIHIKINESQVFSMRDAFFVASRGQFISRVHVQHFGFSEHPRKLPKALTRVITEIDVPIGKTARSQYVDFHTSCESPHKNQVGWLRFEAVDCKDNICLISTGNYLYFLGRNNIQWIHFFLFTDEVTTKDIKETAEEKKVTIKQLS